MQEGWHGQEYLILFSQDEAAQAAQAYQFQERLPGYHLVGLAGWDDFLIKDSLGQLYSIPTIPLDLSYLKPYSLLATEGLVPDSRLQGKIKWYVTPLIFGGSATDESNVAWVSHSQHAELVNWWHQQYLAAKAQAAGS